MTTIVDLLYGEFYAAGAIVLALLSLGQFVNVWSGACGFTLTMTGYQRASMTIAIVRGLLTAAAALVLVRPYGLVGVAAAMSVGMVAHNILMLLAARRLVGVWTHMRIV